MPPEAVSCVESPIHILDKPIIDAVGSDFIETYTSSVFLQPLFAVTVTV